MSHRPLHLHEELLLLALRDREGTIFGGTMYSFALGGALLAELILAGRVQVEERGWQHRLHVVDPTPTGVPLADEWLAQMVERGKPRSVASWVGRMANTRELKHRVARSLCHRGILRADEDTVLLLFTRRIYPEVDPGPERELMQRLETGIFEDVEVAPRTAVAVSLAHHTGILKAVFDRKRLRTRKKRIEAIATHAAAVGGTDETLQAVQAAIMVAVVIPSVTAAAVASG